MKHSFSDLAALGRDPLQLFLDKSEENSKLVKMRIGLSPVYMLNDAALIKPLLKADESEFGKGRFIKKFEAMLGVTTLTLNGEEYKRRRDVHHEYFTRGLRQNFASEICAVIRQHAAEYAKETSFDVFETMQPLILRVISAIIFGHNTLSASDENILIDAVHNIEKDLADSFFQILPDWPWIRHRKKQRLKASRRAMTYVVEKVLKNATSSRLVHALAEIGLTPEEINNEILLLFLGGHQTMGGAATWLLYSLAIDPQLCERVAQEALQMSGSAGEIDPHQLPQAKLSLNIVREILRLYPSFHWFSRETKRDTEFAGITLRKGTSIIISNWMFHRSPRYWDEPDAFRLNRDYGTPAYIPFGAGPRACIGMGLSMLELQLLALELASAFDFKILSEVPAARPRISISMLPPPIRLQLKPRQTPTQPQGFAEERQSALVD
ncbi:MAG: cytochrome P450 [Pseudomonadota bacterium]